MHRARQATQSSQRSSKEGPSEERLNAHEPAALTDYAVSLGATEVQLSRLDSALLQFQESAMARTAAADQAQAARAGTQGSGHQLPHLEAIQASFGRHDVSNIRAHTDDSARAANQALGAHGFAMGDQVAFATANPSLHLASHEAAHVVQQRHGVQLKGGVGQAGDEYERHADLVADIVVNGGDAEPLLDRYAEGPASGPSVQQGAVQFDKKTNEKENGPFSPQPEGTGQVGEWGGKPLLWDFAQGSSTLTEPHRAKLDDMYDKSPKEWPVYMCIHEAAGYASEEGGENENADLSFRRALAVFQYLVSKERLDADDLTSLKEHSNTVMTGYGETREFGDPPHNRAVIVSLRDEPLGGATELEGVGIEDTRGDELYKGVKPTDSPDKVPFGMGPAKKELPHKKASFWVGRALQVTPSIALNVLPAAGAAIFSGGLAVVGGFVLSVYKGLSAIADANTGGEGMAAVMGASYGMVSASCLKAGTPSPPKNITGADKAAWDRYASLAFSQSSAELKSIGRKLTGANAESEEQVKAVLSERELGFLSMMKTLHDAPEPGLNSVHQGLVQECLDTSEFGIQSGRYLTWPKPSNHINLGTGKDNYEKRHGEEYPYPLGDD